MVTVPIRALSSRSPKFVCRFSVGQRRILYRALWHSKRVRAQCVNCERDLNCIKITVLRDVLCIEGHEQNLLCNPSKRGDHMHADQSTLTCMQRLCVNILPHLVVSYCILTYVISPMLPCMRLSQGTFACICCEAVPHFKSPAFKFC